MYITFMGFAIVTKEDLRLAKKRKLKRFLIMLVIVIAIAFLLLFAETFFGVSNMNFQESFMALFGQGKDNHIRIMQQIRFPRAIGGFLVGGGLAIAGLFMQTGLRNPIASPGTLGVSNAAVLGANIAIIILSENPVNGTTWNNPSPYGVAGIAFVAALISTTLVLLLSSIRQFNPTTTILIGVGFGAGLQAITTLVQYFAADNTLSSAVYWSFGDIGRLNPNDNIMLAILLLVAFVVFLIISNRFDALLAGDANANILGVRVKALRFISIFASSLLTASIVSLCGIIGFIGIIAPHICRRLVGNSHRYLVPVTLFVGAILILGSDFLGRLFSQGTSFPVGAVTALIGAPFFVILLLTKKEVVS